MALTFNYDGDSYFTLQYTGDVLDTARGIDSWLLQPPPDYPYFCYFKQGQNAGLADGVVLTGQTSGAVILVGRVIIPGGSLAGNDAQGILFFKKVSGHIVTGENLRVSTTTYAVTTSAGLNAPIGQMAKSVFLNVETNSIRVAVGGVSPTNAAGTPVSFGAIVKDGDSIVFSGWNDVKTMQMIHAASGSNAVVNAIIHY
jgi:hypothetical protein